MRREFTGYLVQFQNIWSSGFQWPEFQLFSPIYLDDQFDQKFRNIKCHVTMIIEIRFKIRNRNFFLIKHQRMNLLQYYCEN